MKTKPGYKTTEFWLTLATMVVGTLLASGVVAEGSDAAKWVGGAIAILAKLGYDATRTKLKANDAVIRGDIRITKLNTENSFRETQTNKPK